MTHTRRRWSVALKHMEENGKVRNLDSDRTLLNRR